MYGAEDRLLDSIKRVSPKAALILTYTEDSVHIPRRSNARSKRRLPEPITLSDYSEDELMQLLIRMIKTRSLRVEGGINPANSCLRAIVKRVDQKRGSSEFKNIRTLEAELAEVCRRMFVRADRAWLEWARTHSPGEHDDDEARRKLSDEERNRCREITQADVFGPGPLNVRSQSKAWAEIEGLVGLKGVKKAIGQLFAQAASNQCLIIQGKDPIRIGLNRVFMGPPGVGKTTVAHLYGRVLAELGLVSKGTVSVVTPVDLIGRWIGESEVKTQKVLEDAMGGVLVIDDAHMLFTTNSSGSDNSDVFRKGVIDTLVAQISGLPGEDRSVIIAGYPDKLKDMFLQSNSGLQRRFPLEDALHFDPYDDDELCEILDAKMARDGVQMSEAAGRVAREVLSRMRGQPSFGNGGDVDNLLARVRLRQRERLGAVGIDYHAMDELPLEPEDFDKDYDRGSHSEAHRNSIFEGFVGFNEIVQQFTGYQQMADGDAPVRH